MPTLCMLLVGDRVVLRANAPPEAEYALFEIGDIELRSSEPGRVREHGYQTTAARARARLAQLGVTASLARDCAIAMHPVLSSAYARGTAVRHIARYLGAPELFQSDTYDAGSQTYHGVFVDLPTLASDLALSAAGIAVQALYLALLLETEPDDTTVFLSTDAWTRIRKPGERTHRRPNLGAVRALRPALVGLAGRAPQPVVREQLARADVIAFIRARADAAPDDDARALYASLERAISVREMPDRGPLAAPDLWAIETRLDTGNLEGVLELVEEVERTRGRTPGTTYLRARASLALHLEPPKLVAERVSALALSMTSFQELCLLAAEAWLEAGDSRRAMPYARDLVDAPGVDEGLLLRAQRLLARAVGAAPDRLTTHADALAAAPLAPSQPPPPVRPSMPPVSAPEPHVQRSYPPAKSRVPTARGAAAPGDAEPTPPELPPPPPPDPARPSPARDGRLSAPPLAPASPIPPLAMPPNARLTAPAAPASVRQASGRPPPIPPVAASRPPPPVPPKRTRPEGAPVLPSAPPPPLDLELPARDAPASFTLDLPRPDAGGARPSSPPPSQPPTTSQAPPRPTETRPPLRPSRRMGAVRLETRAPPAFDPRAEPDSDTDVAAAAERGRARMSPVPPAPRVPRDEPAGPRPARSHVPPPVDAHARPTPMRPPASSPVPPVRAPLATPILDADLPPQSTEEVARTIEREKDIQRRGAAAPAKSTLHGASLPPFRLENPPPLLPKAPLLPKLGPADELAEHLSLPPGLTAEPRAEGALPESVLEARVVFTQLARELGLDFRLRRGIELRADVSGIEAMQAVLLERFPDHSIPSPEAALELRRHGAFLSEILARRLDAEWVDISPNELGYWAMIIPPDTRVWPFGRVARLIEMGHKERDLVSYFFELSSRARRR